MAMDFFRQLFNPVTPSSLVQSAFADVSGMLQQSSEMLDHALDVLLDNKPLSLNLEDMDDMVDEAERRVRRNILQHLPCASTPCCAMS
jgi:phosphate uptake regulator